MSKMQQHPDGPRIVRALIISFAAAPLLAALILVQSPSARAQTQPAGKVVATIGDRQITGQEVDARIKPQLNGIENQLYQARRHAIEAIAEDYLIATAAKHEGLSSDAYLKREIEDKIASPSDAEVQKLYDEHKEQIREPLEKAKPALIKFLREQQAKQLQQALIQRLGASAQLNVKLAPPRFEVATDGRPALGPASAPVTIVEFSDFQCPYCRRVEDALKEVRKKYGDKVRLVYRDYPLRNHANAQKAAEAGRCANEQNKFWEFHDAMFANQSKLGSVDLKATAARLGADTGKFNRCLDDGKYAAQVSRDVSDGNSLGVDGTPAFFVNGRSLTGAQPARTFEGVIDEELARASQHRAAVN
jgi:protein-disulfide isomerase